MVDYKNILGMPNNKAIVVIENNQYENDILLKNMNQFNYRLFHLEGGRIKSKEDLFNILADVFHFPKYFGHNWDALADFLRDFEWLPSTKGYILVYKNPEVFFHNSITDFRIFLEIVSTAFEYWASLQIRFLVILVPEKELDFEIL